MARTDKKHTYEIQVTSEDGTIHAFTFITTEVIKERWIEPELKRRRGTISSWFNDVLGKLDSLTTASIYLMLEECSWTRFMNNTQHIKDILNELEIDFNVKVEYK